MTTIDPTSALLLIAEAAGVPTCTQCVLQDLGAPADRFASPDRDLSLHANRLDLTPAAAAIYDLVLAEAQRGDWATGSTPDPAGWVNRLLYACRLALQMLPEVHGDVFGRFVLELGDDVQPPRVEGLEPDVHRSIATLQAYVAETDAGDWVDPVALCGALADLHDALRLVAVWHEIWGEPVCTPCRSRGPRPSE